MSPLPSQPIVDECEEEWVTTGKIGSQLVSNHSRCPAVNSSGRVPWCTAEGSLSAKVGSDGCWPGTDCERLPVCAGFSDTGSVIPGEAGVVSVISPSPGAEVPMGGGNTFTVELRV